MSTPVVGKFSLDGSIYNNLKAGLSQQIIDKSLNNFDSPVLSQSGQITLNGFSGLLKNSLDLGKKLLACDFPGIASDVIDNWTDPMTSLIQQRKLANEPTGPSIESDVSFINGFAIPPSPTF